MAFDSLQNIRGLLFPNAPYFPKKNIEDAMDYVPHDGDIIIASYPDTGATLLQYIVLQIVSEGEMYPDINDCLFKYVPYLEASGISVVDKMEKPRLYKHHCPYNMVQKNSKAKYLYTYRRPDDTAISYYHFLSNLEKSPPGLDTYLENFLSGNIGYGNYFDHVLSFYEHKDDENVLLVSYEKLQLNRRDETLRIAKFLGETYYQSLVEDESLVEMILERTSFDYMMKNLSLFYIKREIEEGRKKVDFYQKAMIGNGKKFLSSEQRELLKDMAVKKLEGSELLDEWMTE
ncbi:sulfotransferase family cytosolic 1B member 1 [Nephila pilipes]|uniref:Sulfotransferase family cytosolic 1B member 1 n=1 Tax=Nephila pilipes TaxID=299642 RepID=A0A8X6IBW5_NEPPI|nr:sulfotransferase family cytosolic 1B member 1 [Nephila pilipes]